MCVILPFFLNFILQTSCLHHAFSVIAADQLADPMAKSLIEADSRSNMIYQSLGSVTSLTEREGEIKKHSVA